MDMVWSILLTVFLMFRSLSTQTSLAEKNKKTREWNSHFLTACQGKDRDIQSRSRPLLSNSAFVTACHLLCTLFPFFKIMLGFGIRVHAPTQVYVMPRSQTERLCPLLSTLVSETGPPLTEPRSCLWPRLTGHQVPGTCLPLYQQLWGSQHTPPHQMLHGY